MTFRRGGEVSSVVHPRTIIKSSSACKLGRAGVQLACRLVPALIEESLWQIQQARARHDCAVMKAAEEEASSESLSNMQPAIALSCQHRRLPVEACSPCISTEPAASKFDERSRGRFSDGAEAGYRTPLPIGRSSHAAGRPIQMP